MATHDGRDTICPARVRDDVDPWGGLAWIGRGWWGLAFCSSPGVVVGVASCTGRRAMCWWGMHAECAVRVVHGVGRVGGITEVHTSSTIMRCTARGE